MRWIAALLLLLVLATAATASAAPGRSFVVPGRLAGLAIAGSRVAYAVEPTGAGCRSVWVWNLANGTRTKVSGRSTCAIPRTSTGRGLAEVAISGTRLAWIVQTGGNSEQAETLFAASPASRETVVARSFRTGDVDGALAGTWLGNLVGSSSGIFFNAWRTTAAGATSATIRRLSGTRVTTYVNGIQGLFLRSASPGRLATIGPDGIVRTFHGTTPATKPTSTPPVRAIALDGDRLVSLYKPTDLDVRKADDLLHGPLGSFGAPAGAVTAMAAANGVAVFTIGRTLYAESETTGKTAVIARSTLAWRFVALSSSALVYGGSQTIRVLPFRSVRAAVS
jgi:hypothetical protein